MIAGLVGACQEELTADHLDQETWNILHFNVIFHGKLLFTFTAYSVNTEYYLISLTLVRYQIFYITLHAKCQNWKYCRLYTGVVWCSIAHAML